MARKDEEQRVQIEIAQTEGLKEIKRVKKQMKDKYALLRDTQVKEICEKVGEEHFAAVKALEAEKTRLIEQNGSIGLKYRELESRNRRQEDFIFDA